MKHDFATMPATFHAENMIGSLTGSAAHGSTVELFGVPVLHNTVDLAAREIVQRAQRGTPTIVNFINAHCVNTMKQDPAYARTLRDSDIILPDGSGLRLASLLAGRKFGENLNGTDLFPALCREAAMKAQPIFLLGGAPGVALDAARTMQARYANLMIEGVADGYFSPDDENILIARINASGARILFVGFGVPLQEKWIARVRHRLNVPVILGVGGLFDYYSGRIPRAPQALRAMGCEWAWRLAMEPRRLAKRYLIGNLVFLGHAITHALAARGIVQSVSCAAKRAIDIAGSLAALFMLLPVLLLVSAFIRLEDRGPVFFRQLRIGENGRSFEMLKFRSMYTDAEARRAALLGQSERDGICFKMRNDPRITRIGKFIRRFSIDELPQLINVLRGDMSLVGPRPALGSEVSAYRPTAYKRLRGKPGITCIWQVSGRAEIPFDQQLAMDVAYLRQRGVLTDLAILLRTIPAVLTGRGAY